MTRHFPLLAGLVLSLGFASAQAQVPPSGRLLASNCFQCHGTNGKGPGFESLTGKTASEMFTKLKELQREDEGLMTRHALIYTDAQLQQLAAWLATQR